MSLHSLLHHELSSNAHSPTTLGASAQENVAAASGTLREGLDLVATTTMESHHPPPRQSADVAAAAAASSPEAMQRVFDVAPLNVTNRQRRLTVTIFIIACNIIQMICNLIGVAGGLDISRILGVSGIHANWVAAAYPYVCPSHSPACEASLQASG